MIVLFLGIICLFISSPKPLQGQTPTLLFQTGFEDNTEIELTSLNRNDITGVDNSLPAPNDWSLFPDTENGIGEFFFMYDLESINNLPDMIADFDIDPLDAGNQVLRFQILDHNHDNDDPVGRVQANLYFPDEDLEDCDKNGLKSFRYSVELFIPTDFNCMLASATENAFTFNHEFDFLNIAEFWNNANFAPNMEGWEEDGLRISVNLHKNAGEQEFRITAKADPRDSGNSQWLDPLWWQISDATIGGTTSTLPLGQWLTLEIFFIEGDENTGKFVVRIEDIDFIDVTDFTHHPGEPTEDCPNNTEGPDGVKHMNPLKLYSNDVLLEGTTDEFDEIEIPGFNNAPGDPICHILWDDFLLEKDFIPEDHGIIFPTNTSATEYLSSCATIAGSAQDAQEGTSGSTTGTQLALHDHHVGLQFTGLDIPANATIVDAFIQFTSNIENDAITVEPVISNIFGEFLTTPPAAFTDINIASRVGVTTSAPAVEWEIDPWNGVGLNGSFQATANLKSIITFIMGTAPIMPNDPDRGINTGDVLSFIFQPHPDNASSTGQRIAKSSEGGVPAQLCVTYILEGGNCFTITAMANDAEQETASGTCDPCATTCPTTMDLDDHDLDLGRDFIGLRFDDVNIPPGATITEAYIQFKASNNPASDPMMVSITVEKEQNPNPFNTGDDLETRYTSNNASNEIDWNITTDWAEDDALNPNQRTPDLSQLIVAVLTSIDPSNDGINATTGEAISIIINNGESDYCEDNAHKVYSANHTGPAAVPPTLCIKYQLSANISSLCDSELAIPGVVVDFTIDDDDIDNIFDDDPCNLGTNNKSTTDASGDYQLKLCTMPDLAYQLEPSKEDDYLCGVNVYDLFFLQQHFKFPINQHNPIYTTTTGRSAADVDGDLDIDMDDHILLRAQILSPYTLPNPNFIPWKFQDAAESLSLPANAYSAPELTETITFSFPGVIGVADFEAIKTGDVDCTCTEEELMLLTPDVEILLKNIPANENEFIDVVFKVTNFTNLSAYQMGLHFDSTRLEYISTSIGDLNKGADPAHFGLTEVNSGHIRNAWWYDPLLISVGDTSLTDSASIFTMQFKALEAFTALSDLIWLDDQLLTNLAFKANRDIHQLSLQFLPFSGTGRDAENNTTSSLWLKQVDCFPNPVNEQMNLELQLLQEGDIYIQLFDAMGKVLLEQELYLPSGRQVILFNQIKHWQKGVYHYAVKVDDALFSGKFVKQ